MASNGRMGFRSGSPSFLVVGLSLVIVVLLYSYWSVSSRNSILLRDQTFLQDRLRTLSSQKSRVEQKYVAARTQITDVEKAKRKLEAKDISSAQKQSQLDSKIKELENELLSSKQRFQSALRREGKSKNELTNLKSEIETTKKKFQEMKIKAQSMMYMHQELAQKFKSQSRELLTAKNEREVCQVQLDQAKKGQPQTKPKEFKPNIPREDNKEPSEIENETTASPQIVVQTTSITTLENKTITQEPSLDQAKPYKPKKGLSHILQKSGKAKKKFTRFHRNRPGLNDAKTTASTVLQGDKMLNSSKPTTQIYTSTENLQNLKNKTTTPTLNISMNSTATKDIHVANNSSLKPMKNSLLLNTTSSPITASEQKPVVADGKATKVEEEKSSKNSSKKDRKPIKEEDEDEEDKNEKNVEDEENLIDKEKELQMNNPLPRRGKFGDRFGIEQRRRPPPIE